MLVTELGMVSEVRPLQPEKASLPMLVTELGITVFWHPAIRVLEAVSIIALQLLWLSYTVFPLSTVIEVKLSQEVNGLSPMEVTELGIVTEVKRMQEKNA